MGFLLRVWRGLPLSAGGRWRLTWLLTQKFLVGVTVVDTMKKVLAGEKVPQILLAPSAVVTPDNLADYLAGKLWTEPVAGAPEMDNVKPTVP